MLEHKWLRVFRGDSLPQPDQYEEGDLFMLYPPAELYVRSGGNWVLIGSSLASAVVTDGANVGTGTGEVFRDKTGTILNFRTLKNNDGAIVITTSGDEVNIDINTSGPSAPVTDAQNVGGAYRVFRDKTGNTLNFRTLQDVSSGYEILAGESGDVIEFRGIADSGVGVPLISGATLNDVELKGLESSDGSIFIDDLGSSIDLTVDTTAIGMVTDGQNVGSGIGHVYYGKSGSTLQFRTLDNAGTFGAGVLKGDSGQEIEFRRIVGGDGISVSESTDVITIAEKPWSYTLLLTKFGSHDPGTVNGYWWHQHDFTYTLPATWSSDYDLILFEIDILVNGGAISTTLDGFWFGRVVSGKNYVAFMIGASGGAGIPNDGSQIRVYTAYIANPSQLASALGSGTNTYRVRYGGRTAYGDPSYVSYSLYMYGIRVSP